MPPASFRQTAGLGHVGVLRLFSGATGLLSYCCSSWRINGSGRRNVPQKKKKKEKKRKNTGIEYWLKWSAALNISTYYPESQRHGALWMLKSRSCETESSLFISTSVHLDELQPPSPTPTGQNHLLLCRDEHDLGLDFCVGRIWNKTPRGWFFFCSPSAFSCSRWRVLREAEHPQQQQVCFLFLLFII